MNNLIPFLSTVLPLVASTLVIIVLSINFYFKIRRRFPISVNCWFCNSWTKVAYDDKDGFDCPHCLQYNGFTKDGGYNKIIPEQHDELMNKSTRIKTQYFKNPASNGLCTLCNNNQRLKIFQLANFVPLVEENYDIEIEHFQEQLEKAYKLCKKCDRVLKTTINKQNAWLFGNHIKNICSNGLPSLNKISNQIRKGFKSSLLSKFSRFATFLLALSVVLVMLSGFDLFSDQLAKYIPKVYLSTLKGLITLLNSTRVVELNTLGFDLKTKFQLDSCIVICCIGLCLQSLEIVCDNCSMTVKINRILCWTILLLTSWMRFNKNQAVYILIVELFCCSYLMSAPFIKNEERKTFSKVKGKAMRKIVKNLEYTCSDITDTSDFEDVSSSSKKYESSRDSSYDLNKSIYSSQSQLNYQNRVPLQNHSFNTANNVLNSNFGPANCSFTTAKSFSNISDSYESALMKPQQSLDVDLNKSLNNLHLGSLNLKPLNRPLSVTSLPIKRPKPVLSPPKLPINSWVAGGFWRNIDGVILPLAQRTNLSRSSSESSGFGSQHNENFNNHLLQIPKNQGFAEFDKAPMNSEFCNYKPNNSMFSPFQEPKKPFCYRNNTFYPNLNQSNMLYVQGDRNHMSSPTVFSCKSAPYSVHDFNLGEPHQRRNLFKI